MSDEIYYLIYLITIIVIVISIFYATKVGSQLKRIACGKDAIKKGELVKIVNQTYLALLVFTIAGTSLFFIPDIMLNDVDFSTLGVALLCVIIFPGLGLTFSIGRYVVLIWRDSRII